MTDHVHEQPTLSGARHYLDHASTSPLRPEARAAMAAFLDQPLHADPGRPYIEGRVASAVIEAARDDLARMLNVGERQIIFTSSGTEAANLANFTARSSSPDRPIVCAGIEHAAVRLSAERGGDVLEWRVDSTGRLDLDQLSALIDLRPALVHCQYVNHEVGTIQDVATVVALCHEHGIAVHVDGCAAIGQMPIDAGALDADYLSLSAHKFGGPTGLGALVLGRTKRVRPLLVGGDQERARRAGLEHALGIVGLGAIASAMTPDALELHSQSMSKWRDELIASTRALDGVELFGDDTHRGPQLFCASIAGIEAEGVVLGLDQAGVACHSGSACSSEAFEPSPVLRAMGADSNHSLRVSVGWSTTTDDVAAYRERLPEVVASLRALAS